MGYDCGFATLVIVTLSLHPSYVSCYTLVIHVYNKGCCNFFRANDDISIALFKHNSSKLVGNIHSVCTLFGIY